MSALESDKRSSTNDISIERSSDTVSTEVKPGADSHTANQSALKEFSDENHTHVFKSETNGQLTSATESKRASKDSSLNQVNILTCQNRRKTLRASYRYRKTYLSSKEKSL